MQRDKNGRLSRIEYRGKQLRVSRTGGVSLREQTQVAGLNLTVNSEHGTRVSTRVARGTNVGFQNGRFVLRGRYGKGATKLNVSKSGVSVSSKTSVGTFNWFKPRYSSAKIAGIQVRGKNAVLINGVVAAFQLVFLLIGAIFVALVWLFQGTYWLIRKLFGMTQMKIRQRRQRRIEAFEKRWGQAWSQRPEGVLLAGMTHLLFSVATGAAQRHLNTIQNILSAVPSAGTAHSLLHSVSPQAERVGIELVETMLMERGLKPALLIETLFGTTVEAYRKQVDETRLLATFIGLDEAIVALGDRNQLQENLLTVYAYTCGIVQSDPTDHMQPPD